MSEKELRSKVIRLAHSNPELREHLLPLVTEKTANFKGSLFDASIKVETVLRENTKSTDLWFANLSREMKRSSTIMSSVFYIILSGHKASFSLNEPDFNSLSNEELDLIPELKIGLRGKNISEIVQDPYTGKPDQNKHYISVRLFTGNKRDEVKRFGFNVTPKEIIQFVEMFIKKYN